MRFAGPSSRAGFGYQDSLYSDHSLVRPRVNSPPGIAAMPGGWAVKTFWQNTSRQTQRTDRVSLCKPETRVARALMPAASALMRTLVPLPQPKCLSRFDKRPHECGRGRHECPRHVLTIDAGELICRNVPVRA